MVSIRILVGLLAIVSVAASMAFAALLTHPVFSNEEAGAALPAPAVAARSETPERTETPRSQTPDRAEILLRVEQLNRRLQADPSDGEGWKMLGRSMMVLERYAEAVSAYSQAAQIRPNDPEIRGALSQLESIAQQRGKHDQQE